MKLTRVRLAVITAATLATALLSPAARSHPAPALPAWNRYQVIMWSTGVPRDPGRWIARLKELGFTAEELPPGAEPSPYEARHFEYYVENLVNELGFLNARHTLYDEDFQHYTATRDPRYAVRRPSLDDPAFWSEKERTLPELVRPYAGRHPLLYDLRDELSVGSFASPMDYDFSPSALAGFRDWLRERYGSLEALNAEWGSQFATWDAVRPSTTYEIKSRERPDLAAGRPENYASWADHREYMDLSLARTLARLKGIIRRVDPVTPVGIEGAQMPSAWGGYDLWRLSRAIDWVEPYDIAESREIFRSFLPPTAPVLSTVFGNDVPRIRHRLWRLLLDGDRGCIVWDDDQSRCIEKDSPEMPVTARGKALAPVFAELERFAPELIGLTRRDDPIAVHYSQASIRAHWMFDSREDGDTWPRRFSSYEASHSRFAQDRDGTVGLLEDLGLQSRFVSYEQLAGGELRKHGYRVLFLPQSVAMSEQECAQVRDFVRGGGTVIADAMPATMDEHCRRLSSGRIDDLFGIRRRAGSQSAEAGEAPARAPGSAPLRLFEPEISVTTGTPKLTVRGVPAVIVNHVGTGRAVYLNLDLRGYTAERAHPDHPSDLREIVRGVLAESGIRPAVKVTRADGQAVAGVRIWRLSGAGREYVALLRNPPASAESTGPVQYAAGEAGTQKLVVTLPSASQITDLLTGKPLGSGKRVSVDLPAWSPVILRMEPAR